MKKIILAILVLVALPSIAFSQCRDCPNCGHKVATGIPKNTKVKKKVFTVETKDIAVPEICLPRPFFSVREQLDKLFKRKCVPGDPCGDACGTSGCTCEPVRHGRVRTVKVLKKKTIECDKCAYEWEISEVAQCDESGHVISGEAQSNAQTKMLQYSDNTAGQSVEKTNGYNRAGQSISAQPVSRRLNDNPIIIETNRRRETTQPPVQIVPIQGRGR